MSEQGEFYCDASPGTSNWYVWRKARGGDIHVAMFDGPHAEADAREHVAKCNARAAAALSAESHSQRVAELVAFARRAVDDYTAWGWGEKARNLKAAILAVAQPEPLTETWTTRPVPSLSAIDEPSGRTWIVEHGDVIQRTCFRGEGAKAKAEAFLADLKAKAQPEPPKPPPIHTAEQVKTAQEKYYAELWEWLIARPLRESPKSPPRYIAEGRQIKDTADPQDVRVVLSLDDFPGLNRIGLARAVADILNAEAAGEPAP